MAYFKLAFYIEADNLEAAHEQLAERLNGGEFADTDQLITLEQFENQNN